MDMVQKYAKKSSYAVSWIIHSLVMKITAKPLILRYTEGGKTWFVIVLFMI